MSQAMPPSPLDALPEDVPEDLEGRILFYLRRIDLRQERMERRLDDILAKLSSPEMEYLLPTQTASEEAETLARLQAGMDRLREEVRRIQSRLEIATPAH